MDHRARRDGPHTPMSELGRPACGRRGTALPLCGIGWLTSMAFRYRKPGTDLAKQSRTMHLNRWGLILLLSAALWPETARAQTPPPVDQFCDSAFENCRDPLIQLIRNEQVAIDVGMWFME